MTAKGANCYCVCHSPISSRASCEHCLGDNEVGRYHKLKNIKLYALMQEVDGQWKLAHRIKKTHSTYSNPVTNRPLVFNTRRKAEKALEPTPNGNYLPEGTKVITLEGVLDDNQSRRNE